MGVEGAIRIAHVHIIIILWFMHHQANRKYDVKPCIQNVFGTLK